MQNGSEFSFYPGSGRYYLLAYEDANEDRKYQESEYAGAYGNPTIIDVDSGSDYEEIELRLRALESHLHKLAILLMLPIRNKLWLQCRIG